MFVTKVTKIGQTFPALRNFCRNGGKKFDVAEGEVTSVKGDKVRNQINSIITLNFSHLLVSFIEKASHLLEPTSLCKICVNQANLQSSPQLDDKSPKVRVCEGGKLIKKAKEEVPQPFVIGCGGEIFIGFM